MRVFTERAWLRHMEDHRAEVRAAAILARIQLLSQHMDANAPVCPICDGAGRITITPVRTPDDTRRSA